MSSAEVLERARAFVISRLSERNDVAVPFLGVLTARFEKEYIVAAGNRRTLMPPRVVPDFRPSEYLLAARRYTKIDFDLPDSFYTREFVSNLALLYDYPEAEVREVLESDARALLNGLFRGRRVSFLNLFDLYVTEEVEGVLLLNVVYNLELFGVLNRDFSIYPPTTIGAEVDFPDLRVATSEDDDAEKVQYAIADTPVAVTEPQEVPTTETEIEIEEETETKIEEASPSEVVPPTVDVVKPDRTKRAKRSDRIWWVLTAVGVIVAAAFLLLRTSPQPREPQEVSLAALPISDALPMDTTATADTTDTAVEPVYQPLDTIQVGRGGSLAQIARAYYGNVYYWVYLYMANVDSIPDPDNLELGQTLIIPPLEWYELAPDSLTAVTEAKAWESIILNGRYTSYEALRPSVKKSL
ncbi:MAG: hypothetical protein Q4E10_02675 [Porphyromonas sp.]|nr:hypothetical protein [Porphyromonas sp.]